MTLIAGLLSSLHRIRMDALEAIPLPRHDFAEYFFSGAREHPDIWKPLDSLVQAAQIKQDQLIHGDFHLNNIVEEDSRFTIIDWTNGQLGDSRYDFAWSFTLQKIYLSERNADVFRSAYLAENHLGQQELDAFEALACLRWMLLYRNGGAPGGTKAMERVRGIQLANPFLNGFEEISIKISK